MWKCRECAAEETTRYQLLKHYRLKHGHFGRRHPYPCIYLSCPCKFKTWNGLRSHLCRSHVDQTSQKLVDGTTFCCHHCSRSHIASLKEFLSHVNDHLKRHETICCLFDNCSFTTNIYGTYQTHKNRKHKKYTLKDFKAGIVRNYTSDSQNATLGDTCLTERDELNDDTELEHGALVPDHENLPKIIEQKLAFVLLKLENCFHVAASAVDELLNELQYLVSSALLPVSNNILFDFFNKNNLQVDQELIKELGCSLYSSNPLSKALGKEGPLATAFKRRQYYNDNFNSVKPVQFILDAKAKRSFQYVPLITFLQQLLNQKEVLNQVIENRRRQQIVSDQLHYRFFEDGQYFKNNDFLSGEELRISICLYVDDFEVCNPLGTSRKIHKLCAVYWILGNLPPSSHSSLASIYLALLCKSDDVKTYGYRKICEPLLQDLVTLEQEGVFVSQLGTFVKGTLQCVVSDNLAAHGIAGFVESFSGPYCCRFCTAHREEIQVTEVKSGAFTPRNKELHQFHINTALASEGSFFGVKKACIFTERLAHFCVTSGYPPDVVHDLFEGIVPIELALCFGQLISKKLLTLSDLNNHIKNFQYKWGDKKNRPHLVPLSFSSRKTIGGNAHENWCLLRLLPFMIGHLIPEDEPAWKVILDLKDIVELVVATFHCEESVAYLEYKISEHRRRYKEVFPDQRIRPKHHFLEHYPEMIKLFGPIVKFWTMRFEAKHSYFKQVVRHTKCFKNITLSLANKHQLMIGYHMHTRSYQRSGFDVTNVSTIPLDVMKEDVSLHLRQKFPDLTTVTLAQSVSSNGIEYRNGMIIVHGSVGGLPEFAEILQMCTLENTLIFICRRLASWYREHYRAFEIQSYSERQIVVAELNELTDNYPLVDYKCGTWRMINLSTKMATSAVLRIILGENDAAKVTLPLGIPDSVEELKSEIKRQCQLSDFRLQYMDVVFDEFMNLTSTSDIQNKATLKVIYLPIPLSTSSPCLSSVERSLEEVNSNSTVDTDILSVSSESSSSLRCEPWPDVFPVPEFVYDVQIQLQRANDDFKSNGTLFDPTPRMKSEILEGLASEIMKYKAYPSSAEFDGVAEALVKKHPCLRERGSVSGFSGWKISLKYKMANYRTKLRNIGCAELDVNSLKRKEGLSKEKLEEERVALLSEVTKGNNQQVVKEKMERTFAYRRHEVIEEKPFIAEFKRRWPALFSEREVEAEFTRITTVPLISKFMYQLDHHSSQLMKVFRKKGGAAGRKIKHILADIEKNDCVENRRACTLKALTMYLNEDPENLIREYLDVEDNQDAMDQTVLGVFAIKKEDAGPTDGLEDVGIIIEGVEVLHDLRDVGNAVALLLGLMYSLDLSYPKKLKCTFEVLQKLVMELNVTNLSTKAQISKSYILFFAEIAGFPNVIGAIDCTHIAIKAPSEGEYAYVNRKHFHSLNVQIICDAQMRLTNIVARWPGSTHDSFVLTNSSVGNRLEPGSPICCNCTNSPLRPWLLTPLANPLTVREQRYNNIHARTRSVVERAIGQLKSRWRCLDWSGGMLLYHPEKVCRIVQACGVLHNIAHRHGVPLHEVMALRRSRPRTKQCAAQCRSHSNSAADGKMIIKVQYQNRKKYIKLQDADFGEFISEVTEKFSIHGDKITVEDDSGTEVDEAVFAELCAMDGICFVIKDSCDDDSGRSQSSAPASSPSESFLSVSISSSDSETSRPPKRLRMDDEAFQSSSARDLIKQILQTKPGGTTVLEEYEETGMLCDSRRRQMVNILAAHMVETEGRIPQRITKEKYALGIVTLFPALKDPLSRKGYEHFYDSESGSGFLAWRLKTIQRKTKLVSNEPKMQTARGGGPRQEREVPQIGGQLDDERCKEVISLMNHISDGKIILLKMKETFEYRQRLIHNPDESHTVLCVSKAPGHKGAEISAKLLEKWHTFYKGKVIREAESLTTTPVLQSLLSPSFEKQSTTSAEYLLLLTLSTAVHCFHAGTHLCFSKVGMCQTPSTVVNTLTLHNSQVHFVFSLSYDAALNNMYTFLQTTVYGLDVDTTKESPKVKNVLFFVLKKNVHCSSKVLQVLESI
ncbi:putative nuclease HARBI1 [Merluccius polli]|uniref:Nuclease HARBI1 n=1 Tax=Merluccius polli TaxID=89951 RepID=A0AA47MYQ1_MERPO|nr:putative nuclease HARBI1 [Merluccius polli]